eukprot:4992724-Prymnesium_polylepis.1
MHFTPFVTVSYCWSDRAHPDADGEQLKVLAQAIKWYQKERSFLSMTGGLSKVRIPREKNDDFALFLDYSSLYQHPRTDDESAAFKRALASMDLLYAHQQTCVWRMTRRLGDFLE